MSFWSMWIRLPVQKLLNSLKQKDIFICLRLHVKHQLTVQIIIPSDRCDQHYAAETSPEEENATEIDEQTNYGQRGM